MTVTERLNRLREVVMKKLLLFAFACGIIAGANCATATIDGVTWTYTIENDQVRIGGGTSSETTKR